MHQMPQVIRRLAIVGLILVTLCACDDDQARQEVTSMDVSRPLMCLVWE